MAVQFKTIKFKHYRQAREINKLVGAGTVEDEDILRFSLSLVESWDFLDGDTQESLPPGLESLDELTMEQCAEVNMLFASKVNGVAAVPKSNAELSPSTSMQSSQAESPHSLVQSG